MASVRIRLSVKVSQTLLRVVQKHGLDVLA
jgi:hypothetical protein